MNKTPSQQWTEDQREYWKIHLELIGLLHDIGPSVGASNRLPLFWFRTRLETVYGHEKRELIEKAISKIDRLVYLRTQGAEPPFKGQRYL